MRILHVIPSFYPAVAFGGPIFSTKAICDGVAKLDGFEIDVLTVDAASETAGDRLKLDEKLQVFSGDYKVRYCRRLAGVSISLELLWRLPIAIKNADVVHLTGPYSFPVLPTLALARFYRKPVVWSARGGLQATEQWPDTPKRGAKKLFERLANFVRPSSTVLHVTASEEADFSCRRLGDIDTRHIPNSVTIPDSIPERNWHKKDEIRIVFLSRVHPKKGLNVLLSALEMLPKGITLLIYGDGTDSYISLLQSQAKQLGCLDRITFHGHVAGGAKLAALTSGEIFCLPTFSENFGIVVAEALAHGTPVVTTVNAPWQRIEEEGCGRWVEAEPASLAKAISELSEQNLKEMGERGRAWMKREFSPEIMADKFADLYRSLIS